MTSSPETPAPPAAADLWRFAEAHRRDPAAVLPMARTLARAPVSLARMAEEIQRATGGRRREMLAEEVARYHLGLCIRCERPRPGRGRYCGEMCRRERNRPDKPGQMTETEHRRRALRVKTREDVRVALLSWLTRAPGTWARAADADADAEALGFLADLRADLDTLTRAGRELGAEGVGQREARKALAEALEDLDG